MKQSQFDILIDKRSGVKIIIPISPKLDPKHPLSIFSPLSVYKPSTPIHCLQSIHKQKASAHYYSTISSNHEGSV